MARPTKNDILSGNQNWDGPVDDNDEALFNAPIPIHEHTGDETDLEAAFAAAAYDRCLVWVNDTEDSWTLYHSTGTEWLVFREDHKHFAFTSTTAQTTAHDFVEFTSTGAVDYDLLPAASWPGRYIEVRNDKTTGALNIDPNGSEEINSLGAGVAANPAIGETIRLFSNGTKIFASIMADAV